MVDANKNRINVILDMTHLTSKRRKKNLKYFNNDYYKLCVIFPLLSDYEYERRNQKRIKEENKNLPIHIVKNMISKYQPVGQDEGFDEIISL